MDTKTLDLRALSDDARNQAVNEAIAIHVCGWVIDKHVITEARTLTLDEDWIYAEDVSTYIASTDFILPLLEKWHDADADLRDVVMCRRLSKDWMTTLRTRGRPFDSWDDTHRATGPLAESICLALLRANGIEVLA